jgi:hypothetical protein
MADGSHDDRHSRTKWSLQDLHKLASTRIERRNLTEIPAIGKKAAYCVPEALLSRSV